MASDLLEFGLFMNCRNRNLKAQRLANAWLAGLLAVWLVVLGLDAVTHRSHACDADHHNCAACLLAHGGVIADGAMGAAIVLPDAPPILALTSRTYLPLSSDLLLAPGRAPPV